MIDHRYIPNRNLNWNDSLFNCFTQLIPSCFESLFCPCILMGQISEAVNFAPCICVCFGYGSLLLIFIVLGTFNRIGELFVWFITAILVWSIRQKVRTHYSMTSNFIEDFFVSCFCSTCAISQVILLLFFINLSFIYYLY